MKPEIIAIFGIYFGFALIEAFRTGLFRKPNQTRDDAIVEIVSTVATLGITQPFVVAMSAVALGVLLPQYAGALTGINYFAGFLLFLIFDDFVNYLYHRAAHSNAWLYGLHRAHHSGEYMGVRVLFRNNVFYYLLAPHLWASGTLIYLGLGWVYASYLVIRVTVSIASHSDVCWDRPLYANPLTARLMWPIERLIVTPSAHHAHHGKHATDGVTHYKGNYGNTLLLWDVLLGTAHITRKFPESYGVENLPSANAAEQLFWPVVRNSSQHPDAKGKADGELTQREKVNG
jgi:sterol desaturase/sphingolipid hydroxylase (fatty acid hydroxylase superfamily)